MVALGLAQNGLFFISRKTPEIVMRRRRGVQGGLGGDGRVCDRAEGW